SAERADSEFAKLTPDQEPIAQQVFTRLVRVARSDEAGQDTRRRVPFSELGTAARPVVQLLTDARLLVTATDEVTGYEMVEVAHETLIRTWPRLRIWLDQDREFLLWRQRLSG